MDTNLSGRLLRADVSLAWSELSAEFVKRPQYFGILTNDIVYRRLAPGVLDELKKITLKTRLVDQSKDFSSASLAT